MDFSKDVSQPVPAGSYQYIAKVNVGSVTLSLSFTDEADSFVQIPDGYFVNDSANVLTFNADCFVKANIIGGATFSMNTA